jgi:hypothetical protein
MPWRRDSSILPADAVSRFTPHLGFGTGGQSIAIRLPAQGKVELQRSESFLHRQFSHRETNPIEPLNSSS